MLKDSRYKKLVEIVSDKLSCSAHNLDYVFRVYKLCMLIAEAEDGVDLEVLIPAALLHDIARVEESQDQSGKIDHAVLGSEMAEAILLNLEYDIEKINRIKHCIIAHRFRTGNEPKTIEAKILFDADKLDVIGATGIARTFMLAGQFGQRINQNNELDQYLENNSVENGRLKDVSKHSPLIEYEIKFKKIPNKLYTDKAKSIGYKRLEYMENYFNQLSSEFEGIE